MASLSERPRSDGSVAYIVRFRHNGRQTSETFDNERARSRFVRNLEQFGPEQARKILDATDESAADIPTFKQLALDHIELIEAGDTTRRKYRGYLRNDTTTLNDLPVDAITTDMIERWVRSLTAAGQSAKTVKNKHGFVSGVFTRAVRRRLITDNPCTGYRLPTVRKAHTDFLDADEFAIFINYIPARWRPLVTLLFTTGMRWGEATALQVNDLDLDHARINVRRAWKRDDDGWVSRETKTRKSDRWVTIGPSVITILRDHVRGKPRDALVFTNAFGGPVRHASFHDSVWQPAVMLANGEDPWPDRQRTIKRTSQWVGIKPAERPLGKWPKIHAMRHSAGTNLAAMGIDLKTIQEQLGHESITTTADLYGHVTVQQRLALAEAQERTLTQAYPQIES